MHIRRNPPTAFTALLHLIKLLAFSPIALRCLGPPKEIEAPLSGNTLIVFLLGDGMFLKGLGSFSHLKGVKVIFSS